MAGAGPGRTPKGFTLLELVLVLALVAVVSALIVPFAVGTLRDADQVKAEADVNQIAGALTRFYADLRHLPACSGADCSRIVPGANNGLAFLAVGEGDGGLAANLPEERSSAGPRWNLLASQDASAPARHNAFNHLVRNDPNADGVIDAGDYASRRRGWRGPYLATLGPDPWGRAYVVSVGAMEAGGRPVAVGARGWILSAGPNGVLETAPDADVPGGDDIGLLVDAPRPS